MSNDHAALVARLTDSLRSGLLFDNLDEPLDAYGKRIVRVVLAALSPTASEGAQATAEMECPECHGQGWISGTGSEHAPGCDGECHDCPVPVEIQIGCEFCGGKGEVPAPAAVREPEPSEALDLEALARAEFEAEWPLLVPMVAPAHADYMRYRLQCSLERVVRAALARVKGQ
jgi:RecJ-like exonuclease